MRISALSPFGPIFGKELRTTARRKRTYVLRVLYLALLLLVMASIDSNIRTRQFDTSAARRAQEAANMGRQFFIGFAGFCSISLTLIAPVLTATAINAERQSKTLHVLLMTPITGWQIVSGKLMSRLLTVFTLLGLSLPVLAVVRLLGGVDLDRMFWVIVLCLGTSLFAAALGLFFSTLVDRAYSVILLSYATLLVLYLFVPFFVSLMLMPSLRGPGNGLLQFLAAINPFLIIITGQAADERPFSTFSPMPTLVLHLTAAALLVVWSASLLRKRARREGDGAAALTESNPTLPATVMPLDSTAPEAIPPVMYPPSPLPPKARRSEVSDNPVLWRELRRPLTAKRWQAVTFVLISSVLLILSYLAISNNSRGLQWVGTQIGYADIFCFLLALMACVLSSTAIAGEKESDTWTVLLATPLSARSIVLGKVAGQFRRIFAPVLLMLSHFTLFMVCGVIPFTCYVGILWMLVSFNVIWIATGVYLSLRVSRTTLAVALNLLLPVSMFLLVPLLLSVAGSLTGDESRWGSLIEYYLPYEYLNSWIDGFRHNPSSFHLPDRLGQQVDLGTMVSWVGACSVIYLILTVIILAHTISRFDRFVGRSQAGQA